MKSSTTHSVLNVRWLGAIALASLALALPIGAGGGGAAEATSGGLDSVGGHHCWTRCEGQGPRMYTGKYHCHQKTAACKASKKVHRAHGH